MESILRAAIVLMLLLVPGEGAAGQDAVGPQADAARASYLRAVAGYFALPPNEIAILADWELPADEIPVVLFVARSAGVSPEALVALRGSGMTWRALAGRYRITPAALHVPLAAQANAGPLGNAYAAFRGTPAAEWARIELTDPEIVGLVNLRVLAQVLGASPEDVLTRAAGLPTFVETYARLARPGI